MTDPGVLRHRVTLQQVAAVKGAGGRKDETPTDIATVWASIRPSAKSLQTRADKLEFATTHEIRTRYSAPYKDARRIVEGNRVYIVQSVINVDERGRWLVFRCEEGSAE